jgi:ATP-dependent Lon protease
MSINYKEKINFFKEVINNIQVGIKYYHLMNILNSNEYNNCLEGLESIIELINTITIDNAINDLQYINNNLSSIIKNYGIYNFENFLSICLHNEFSKKYLMDDKLNNKLELIRKYLHPINYKILSWTEKGNRNGKKLVVKEISKNKIIDDKIIIEESEQLECFDLMRTSTNFNLRVYGIKVIIHDIENKKTLCVNCLVDDLLLNNMDQLFINSRSVELKKFVENNEINKMDIFIEKSWINFNNNLMLKDYLIYSDQELLNKYIFMMTQINNLENKTINAIVQDFIGAELFNQRSIIIQLLLNNYKQEYQYIAYLLYDLLSIETQSSNDSTEQKLLYDSLPLQCKNFFKNAMYKTIEYTTSLSNFDNNKIPLEQQICLMKVNDNVKEKAMQKLKEIKSKSEDSGSKARQYLDGLLKIPFGIYKEEYILKKKVDIINLFNLLKEPLKVIDIDLIENNSIKNFIELIKDLLNKDTYSSIEILNIVDIIAENLKPIYSSIINYILNDTLTKKKSVLLHLLNSIITICKKFDIKITKTANSNDNVGIIRNTIKDLIETNSSNLELLKEIFILIETVNTNKIYNYLINTDKVIVNILKKNSEVTEYIRSFNSTLDGAVHGHLNAKKQIERIIGQWINGEKSGYCFGFEGPPGVGKTTLAKKGLANCLKDIDGESRPFSFIALGGSSNGSILDGHNYTYVGSTWGKIVDILIEKKCMNPIIFIDELDKVSRTEHGKEIIGILTHLIDTTQNDGFQDKYFSNIDLDLSKALFIFSYNDVELIDRILLDRIHRIKFENLLLEDKLVITRDYLLPEFYNKFGILNVIEFSDELITYIIENYTNEPGVRKLKEILFELISSINLDLLKKTQKYNIPVIITKEIVENILYERHYIRYLKINNIPKVGIINGLWANAYGNSGILHIESKFFSTSTFFDLKLTGMQGDVMKESMTVAKTLAVSLISQTQMKKILKDFEETKLQGIHIHVPEGSTPKDGPSAGAAITLVIYSLLTNKKIKNNFAITGEINLQGSVTAIGGLDLKILGGIRAGVTCFLYPKDNAKDFKLFYEKHSKHLDIENYEFFEIDHITDVIKYMIL